MFYPIFWGCKYTNKIRIINNNPVFQHIILLITSLLAPKNMDYGAYSKCNSRDRMELWRFWAVFRHSSGQNGSFRASSVGAVPLFLQKPPQLYKSKEKNSLKQIHLHIFAVIRKIHAFRERCGERTKRKNV